MHHQQIKEVQSHKHLGLYLTNDGSWYDRIQYIKEKAWARVNTMRKLKFKLDRKSLEIIYTTFIRLILEYGNTIWGNCANYEKEELEKIQHEAARIATGTANWFLYTISIMRSNGSPSKNDGMTTRPLFSSK